MAYSLRYMCTKNYSNQTTTAKMISTAKMIVDGWGWVVSFF